MAEFRSLQRQLESVVPPESLIIIQNCVDKNVRIYIGCCLISDEREVVCLHISET